MTAKQTIFSGILGADWAFLPPVFHKHYANRPFSRDVVIAEGMMRVETSWLMRLFSPILRLSGALVPIAGENIPVSVTFRSEPNSAAFCLDREFRFSGRAPYLFRSRMVPTGGSEVIEWMPGGLGWRTAYAFVDGQVRLAHRGYVLRLFSRAIPLPLEPLIGRGEAWEEACDESGFAMAMSIRHPLLGKVYGYSGTFVVREVWLDG